MGADRQILLRIYIDLIQYKLDNSCWFYSSSKPVILNKLDPIQNQCLSAFTKSVCRICDYAPLLCSWYIFKTPFQNPRPTRIPNSEILGNLHELNPAWKRILSLHDIYCKFYFFPSASKLWSYLPASLFPNTYYLSSFKRTFCHHLCCWTSLCYYFHQYISLSKYFYFHTWILLLPLLHAFPVVNECFCSR